MAENSSGGTEQELAHTSQGMRKNVLSYEYGRLRQALPNVVSRCMAYSAMTCFDETLVASVFRFYGLEVDVATAEAEILEDEAERVRFFPWFLWDWRQDEASQTIGERFLAEGELTRHEKSLVAGLCESYVGLYEVIESSESQVVLSELNSAESLVVLDGALAADTSAGQLLQARLVRVRSSDRERVLVDAIYAVLPCEARAAVKLEIESLVGDSGEAVAMQKTYAPEMLDFVEHLLDSLAQPPTALNSDGDELILCTQALSADHSAALVDALREGAIDGATPVEGGSDLWRIHGGLVGVVDATNQRRVTLFANSPSRFAALAETIASGLDTTLPALYSLEDFSHAVQRWAERGGGALWLRADPDVSAAVRGWFATWVRQWLDMPLAALDERTPREAVSTPDGKDAVTRMVQRFEDLLLGQLGAVTSLSLESLRAELRL